MSRVGVWLVGARGSVATTAILGAAALRARLIPHTGCVADLPDFADAGLPTVTDLVFGGHDVTDVPLRKRADLLAHAGVVPAHLPGELTADLAAADAEIRVGVTADQPQRAAVDRATEDIVAFRDRNDLDRVVVINVSSTEPQATPHPAHANLARLEAELDRGGAPLPASSLYAYAALRAGCPVVEFTPSAGPCLPALHELALARRLPYAGRDGKTGETLLKSALAPVFAHRALRVLSWSGTNLLGGGDGATLANADAAASKAASKRRVLEETLGYRVDGPLHIDYVAEHGDWKTAWDHISFEGFLGLRMTMQFTWQGCDSALAAPLVLDLARFAARAHAAGECGPLAALAFFFKDPAATIEHRVVAQFEMLRAWAATLGESTLGESL